MNIWRKSIIFSAHVDLRMQKFEMQREGLSWSQFFQSSAFLKDFIYRYKANRVGVVIRRIENDETRVSAPDWMFTSRLISYSKAPGWISLGCPSSFIFIVILFVLCRYEDETSLRGTFSIPSSIPLTLHLCGLRRNSSLSRAHLHKLRRGHSCSSASSVFTNLLVHKLTPLLPLTQPICIDIKIPCRLVAFSRATELHFPILSETSNGHLRLQFFHFPFLTQSRS